MDIEIVDIEKHRDICRKLDTLEQTIENTKDDHERNKLIKQANELIVSLEKTESENKNSNNNNNNNNSGFGAAMKMVGANIIAGFGNFNNFGPSVLAKGVNHFQYYKTQSKVKYYRDRFDRFNKPKKNIL